MADIQINELLEATTAANADWIAIDNGSATKKISVENFNATGAASAAQSAAAAAQSATDATSAKNAAVQAKDDAQALITSAQTIVSDAQTYANNAQTSAGTASTAANTATAQAAIATNQANLAAGYATNVDSFAKTAKSWAVGGTGTRSGEDTDNSKYYSQQAHDSEINAAASESNASTSETNAAASESTASSAASSASTNALKAEGYAVGTQNGTPAISGETYYHDNAKYYKEQAATSETNAASSEHNAGLSESAAAASESAAKGSEEDSEAWAWGKIDGVDVPSTHPAYHNNAKYWADAASGGVSGVSSFNGRSGVVVPASGDYAANIIEYDPSGNALISTNVQAAIEEVQGNVATLGSSLATVATTGAYSDLSGKPTLGTAAARNSTNSVTSGSIDLIESGAVYTGLSLKANSADLGTAAAKNFTTSVTTGSTDLVTSGAVKDAIDNVPTTWSGLTGKPFSSIGDGLTVFSDMLIADVSAVDLENIGIASASNTSSQQLCLNDNLAGTVVSGSRYMETSTKTTSSGVDTFTFTNAVITANGVYDFYCDVYGVAPSSVVVSSGTMDVKFNSSDNVTTCRVYIK